jgi:ubiquinol-cytochrome c reductase iron-sulfur subunit
MNEIKRRRKLLITLASVVGGIGVLSSVFPFLKSLMPSERARVAGASVEFNLDGLQPGKQTTIKWRGKPIWILNRTPEMLKSLDKTSDTLRDPDSRVASQQPDYAQNKYRSIKPEYFVCTGLCTHLGCIPTFRPDVMPEDLGMNWYGGYFCPCHGSRFDLAGRVNKDVPAPANLVIPPYRYITETMILIGDDIPATG